MSTDVLSHILSVNHMRRSLLFQLLRENAAQHMNAVAITLSAQWTRRWSFVKKESHSETLILILAALLFSVSAMNALPQRNVQRVQSPTNHTASVDVLSEHALLSQCAVLKKRSTNAVRHGLKISALHALAWKCPREHTALSATKHNAQPAQTATLWCLLRDSVAANVFRIAASTTTRHTLLVRIGLHLTISVLLAVAFEML